MQYVLPFVIAILLASTASRAEVKQGPAQMLPICIVGQNQVGAFYPVSLPPPGSPGLEQYMTALVERSCPKGYEADPRDVYCNVTTKITPQVKVGIPATYIQADETEYRYFKQDGSLLGKVVYKEENSPPPANPVEVPCYVQCAGGSTLATATILGATAANVPPDKIAPIDGEKDAPGNKFCSNVQTYLKGNPPNTPSTDCILPSQQAAVLPAKGTLEVNLEDSGERKEKCTPLYRMAPEIYNPCFTKPPTPPGQPRFDYEAASTCQLCERGIEWRADAAGLDSKCEDKVKAAGKVDDIDKLCNDASKAHVFQQNFSFEVKSAVCTLSGPGMNTDEEMSRTAD